MRRACVDIGSNTTRLLVAETARAGLVAVCERRSFTRIGAAVDGDGAIPAATRAAVVAVVAEYVAEARALGAAEVHGIATAAVRNAPNRDRLIAELRDGAGLDVAIVAAESEARLAFRGAIGMQPAPDAGTGRVGVLDVGGGSSEVVVGDPNGAIAWWASLPLGSGSLAAAHFRHDPPTGEEIAAARAAVLGAARTAVTFDGPAPARTFAVGGSATSLGRLAGPALDAAARRRALALLCARPAADVADRHALDPERVRLLPAGLIVLEVLAERLGAGLEVGRGGIREGVLLEAFSR